MHGGLDGWGGWVDGHVSSNQQKLETDIHPPSPNGQDAEVLQVRSCVSGLTLRVCDDIPAHPTGLALVLCTFDPPLALAFRARTATFWWCPWCEPSLRLSPLPPIISLAMRIGSRYCMS